MADGSRTPLARRDFLISCLLICCGLLTLASFTFAMYTVKELSLIKSRVSELETSLGNAHLMITNSKAENTRSLKKKSIRNVEEVLRSRKNRTSETISLKHKRKLRKSISIHLESQASKYLLKDNQPIRIWSVKHKLGHVMYSPATGCVVIHVPGMYFVYSQLQYKGNDSPYVVHTTLVNGKEVLKRIENRKRFGGLDSTYQGAVFPLQKLDRVCISGNFRNLVFLPKSYFGVSLLSRT